MSSSSPLPSRPLIPHIASSCSSCNTPLEFPVPSPQPRSGTLLYIKCFSCHSLTSHAFYPTQIPAHYSSSSIGGMLNGGTGVGSGGSSSSSSGPSGGKRGRKIGTQERPLETGYYDILGVPVTATTDDIKKAYRRLAIKHHPDKNPDDPQAEERFKSIAIAYQTLSDPALRAKYNEFGPKESAPEGGYVDPEEVFSAIFGGERFVPIIGQISLARDMKAALQEAEEAEEDEGTKKVKDSKGKEILSEEERARKEEKDKKKAAEGVYEKKAAARAERINKLVENLERKLGIFTESATGPDDPDVTRSWKTICELEAEDLAHESYGSDLLQAIGFVYVSKAKHHLATNQTFLGVGGWLHNVQGKYHVFSETVSTLRSAIELKSVFDQIQAAEKAGNLSPEEKKKLEEQAAEKGLQALFKGTKLEIESVLRETCDRILEDPAVTREKALLRAVALQILGEAYMGVKGSNSTASSGGTASPGGANASGGTGGYASYASRSSAGAGAGATPGSSAGSGRSSPAPSPRPASGIGSGLGGMFGGFGFGGPSGSASPGGNRRASRGGGMWDESEYVRVDTRSSRAREGR